MTVNRFAAVIALAAALVPAAAASAGNPHAQTQPSASVTTLVSGPTPIKASAIPDGPGAGSMLTAGAAGTAVTAGDCGACLVYCWGATTRSGPSDWSGSVFIYQHLYWCGNGVRVTYGSAWQSYSQSGSYRIDQTYGPWWSGGCIGCATLRASGYILWSWNAPLVSIPQSGTTHLDTTMYAYGVLAY
jgi:hypothetical protein